MFSLVFGDVAFCLNFWFKACLLLIQDWKDMYMHWNPSEYGGLRTIRISSKSIWKPDILIYNSAGRKTFLYYKEKHDLKTKF